MIIGKIMMIQNSSPVDSVEYLISKKTLELKDKIKESTLNRFIEEIGISKTSMVRYLKNINIHKFTYFKNILYEEYMHAKIDMIHVKQHTNIILSEEEKNICEKIQKCNKILILGDGNRFSLMIVQKLFIYLGHPCVIPVYLGSEEQIIKEHNMSNDDLVIIVSLHESYNHFCTNRSIFYRDAKYLDVHAKTRIGFVGISEVQKNDHLYFEYSISDDTFDKKMDQLQKIFLKISTYLLKNNDEY